MVENWGLFLQKKEVATLAVKIVVNYLYVLAKALMEGGSSV